MSSIKGPTSHPETHKSSRHLSSPSHLRFQPGPAVAAGCSRSLRRDLLRQVLGACSSSPGSREQMAGHSRRRPLLGPHPTRLLGEIEAARSPRAHQLPLLGATGQGSRPHVPPRHPQAQPVSQMQARSPSGFIAAVAFRAAGRGLGSAGSFPATIACHLSCPGRGPGPASRRQDVKDKLPARPLQPGRLVKGSNCRRNSPAERNKEP